MDGTLSPVKKSRPDSVPQVMFTGFEPIEVQHYTKVISLGCLEQFLHTLHLLLYLLRLLLP